MSMMKLASREDKKQALVQRKKKLNVKDAQECYNTDFLGIFT